MLESNIESALDTGDIVIVPADENQDEWECIVTAKNCNDLAHLGFTGG